MPVFGAEVTVTAVNGTAFSQGHTCAHSAHELAACIRMVSTTAKDALREAHMTHYHVS